MSFHYKIVNEDNYYQELTKFFNFFLHCDMMQIDVNKATCSELESCIPNYDHGIVHAVGTWCSWLEIGGIHNYINNYGSTTTDVELLTPKGKPLVLNFSQFIYRMSPYVNNGGFCEFDNNKATLINTIDGIEIAPDLFFTKNKGKKLLYVSSVKGVTRFHKPITVYRFAFNKIQRPHLCEYIHQTQIDVLRNFLSYSVAYPCTKVEVLGTSCSHRQYFYDMPVPEVIDFAQKVFDMEYRKIFLDKLTEIEAQDI